MDRKPIFDAVRTILGRGITPQEVGSIDAAIDLALGGAPPAPPSPPKPAAAPAPPPSAPQARRKIAWGAKVSPKFRDRVWDIADKLKVDPDDLMACMAWESGETFSSSVKNAAGSGAVGLIQFMPTTAYALGTTTAALAQMTPEDQLDYVYKYFKPRAGKLKTLSDLYMAILWPKGVGRAEDYKLFVYGTTTYAQNAGLDINKDHCVTKAECAAKVLEKKAKGLLPQNMG